MKFSKIFAAATAIVVTASASYATELVGGPILSDGNTAIAIKRDQGVYKVNVCGANYWLSDSNSISIYKSIRPRLKSNGGYIYFHTATSGKKYYECAWGRYDHLHGKVY